MPRNKILGGIRRGQVLRNHGPGSIIDFKLEQSGSVSIISSSIDQWPNANNPPRYNIKIEEERLQHKLGKDHFRLPPVVAGEDTDGVEENKYRRLKGYRFPRWLQCPVCNEIKKFSKFHTEDGDPSRRCLKCENKTKEKVYAIPTRFITCCTNGHINEFPWEFWYKSQIIHKKGMNCTDTSKIRMRLIQQGSLGLSGLKLQCINCNASNSLENIFSEDTLKNVGYSCSGYQPWLTERDKESCNVSPRVLQRGASNTYFAKEESSLTIPPLNDEFVDIFGFNFRQLSGKTVEEIEQVVNLMDEWKTKLLQQYGDIKKGCEEIYKRNQYLENPQRRDLRAEEYKKFIKPDEKDYDFETIGQQKDFEVRSKEVPSKLLPYLSDLIQVMRLREVMVLTGFTRIYPPDDARSKIAEIVKSNAKDKINWLPASEVRGEGIFIKFSEKKLSQWENIPIIIERSELIKNAYIADWKKRHGEESVAPIKITPRYLMIHTLSHLLTRQLTYECGYYTSALRERLYVSDDLEKMMGLLIYTASSDADGSLGGLSRQAETNRFEKTFISAIKSSAWCSADPLCITKTANIREDYNLAGCHSCVMLPETSCEQFNSFLDRSLVVGDPEGRFEGFFQDLINE